MSSLVVGLLYEGRNC